ncbi:MAG TPA: TatD family hydrolase [Acidimicrobiales bacterium]|nr:TatD family hydrolase [Acidimicrobiales bacterium]
MTDRPPADPLTEPLTDGRPVGEWFDSHCHLQERYLPEVPAGDPDPVTAGADTSGTDGSPVAEVLRRTAVAGVGRMVCVGTDPGTSAQALALARAVAAGDLGAGLPRIWATAGLHPHEAAAGTAETVRLVDEAVATGDGTLVAVGECGLDYHYDHSPRDAQRRAFAEQVALAHRHSLALVIHARDAWDDLFDVLAAEGVPDRTILHCFTGGPAEAERCLGLGLYISFSGIITFKNAPEIREAAVRCPLDRLLIETDSPFLAPVPHRGQPNEPAFVPLVGAAVAAAKGLDPAELGRSSAAAAQAVFGV